MTNVDLFGPAIGAGGVTTRPGESRVFGSVDTWFKDCTDSVTDDGTAYEAAYFNLILANMRAIARGNGLTGGGADVVLYDNGDDLLQRALQHMVQRNQTRYADDTGTADNIIIALTPAPPEIKKGMRVSTKLLADNTGGACTLTVNAIVKNVKTVALQNPAKGMLVANQHATFEYDGTQWQLVSAFSEKVVFTPTALVNISSIASVARSTWAQHNLSAGSNFNLPPVVGANSFTLPTGKYLFNVGCSTSINPVVNATQVAHQIRLTKNAALLGNPDFEATHLTAGQDLTTYRNLNAIVDVISTDVLAVQSWVGTTNAPDFSSAAAGAGTINIIKIGN